MPTESGGPADVVRGAFPSAEVTKAGAFNDSLLFDLNRRRFALEAAFIARFLPHKYKITQS